LGEPTHDEESLTGFFEQNPIDRDLDIIIEKGQGEVDKDRHLIEDSKKDREGSAKGKMDQGKDEDEVSGTG